tara:strand:- start:12060 stop:17936 length:5877 start_codon:yes stop_codon:yes gene_type:complete
MNSVVESARRQYGEKFADFSDEELTLSIGKNYPKLLGKFDDFADDFSSIQADRNEDSGFFNSIRNAWLRGSNQAAVADVLVGETYGGRFTDEDRFEEMALANRRSEALKGSEAYIQFTQAPESEKIGRFFTDPFEIGGQIIIESLAAQVNFGATRTAVGMGAGAAAGSIVPGVGTVAGAGVGFVSGQAITTLGVSYGSKFNEMLINEGVDVRDADAIRDSLQDPQFVASLRDKSLKYGVPVAVVDVLTMKLGGLVTAPAKKLGVESVGGSAGEAAGQLVSEGEITSPSEVLIEGIAELGVGGAQQSALSGINMLKDKQVQQDLKETQSKSDELRNAREKEVLDAYNAELEAQQTVDPELGPMTEVEGVTVTNIDANAGEILQEGSVPNKVVKELDATKFSDFNEVVFIDNDDHTMAGVTGIGRLVINVGKLKKHIKDNGLDADEYIQKLIQEEAIHDAHLKSILGEYDANTTKQSFSEFAAERFQRIADEMTDEQKAYVREVYGQDLEDASMGAEYVRMLVQERRHGSITESLLWNELGLKPAPATRNYFRRAFDFIRRRVKRDNVDPDTIQNEVNNLVGILQDIEDRSNDMGDVEMNRAQAAETAESVQRQEQVELQRAEDAPTSAGMEQQAGIEEQRAATQTDPQMEQQAAVEQQRADAPVTDPEVARQEQIEMERAQRRDVTGVRQTQDPIGPTRPPVRLEWQSLEDILNEPLVVTGSPKVIPSSDVIDQRRTKQVEAGKLDQQPGFQRTAEQSVELEQKQFTEQQEQRGEAERVQPEPLRPPEGAFQEAQTTAEPTTETQQQPTQQEQVLTDEENQFVENISNAYAGKRFFNQTARVDAAASVSTDTKLALLKMRQSGKLDEAQFQQMARTIAANKARDIGRVQKRRSKETTVDENETGQTVFDREEATAPSPEQITRKRERLQRVSKAIDELPAAQREVMQLTAQGLSPAEIVEQTGKSRQAVDTNLSRARAKLMKQPDLMLEASTQGKPDAAKAKSELREVLNEVKELMKTAPFAVHNMPVEQAIRQVLDAQSPEQQRTLDAEVGVKTMDDVDRIFSPLEPDKPSLGERLRSAIESFSTNFLTRFAPLKQLESKVFKVMGKKAPRLDLARKFEQLAGSPARAEKMMMDFHNAVVKPIKGLEQQFNRLMFLRRTRQRLQDNPDRKRVADYSLSDVTKLLEELEASMSPQQMQQLESAVDQYQEFMAAILRMQMNSGRISQETLNNIVESNDFYAPFVVLKHLEDSESTSATGQRIDTTKQLAQMITGIDDTDFRLGNFIDAAYERILTGYMLADKNLKMQELYALSQIDESGLVRELKETKVGAKKTVREKADHEVSVFVDGEQKHLAVNREVARSIEGLNAQTTGMLTKAMAIGAIPMKAGATTFNLAFQFVNLFAADMPRLAMVSKYGFRSPVDLIRLPLDYTYALFSSITGNFGKPNALYKDFLNSGAARSTLQRELTPELFEVKPTERDFKLTPKGMIRALVQVASSIEETSKLVGLKRGMRIEKLAGMTPEQQRERMGEIVAEVRNFAGSPDFGRQGALTRAGQLNLVFMYFNARIQGVAADLGRLAGRDGGKNAALVHARLAAAVGIPTVTLWALNNSDEYKEDYEEIPDRDKENYWHIPTDQFFVNDEGKRIRDYYRIPKREVSKLFANIVESSLKFLETREPKALKEMGVVFLENIMPVSVTGENMDERVESVISSLNPLFKGMLEYGLNRNTWQHRDIIPENLKARSPENQYFKSTPQIFRTIAKEMPEALPESFRSPLMLKQLTGTMTAGLFTQFLPPRETNRKPLGVFSDQSPLFRRFIRSPYVNESETEKQLEAIERTEADRQFKEREAVDQFIEDTKGMSSMNRMIRARQASGGSRTLFQKYKKAIEDDSNLTTRLDKRVRGLPVSSGARSMFIMQQMEGMQYAGKVEYLRGLFQKRVISGQVAQQIFAETGISPSEYTR